MLRFLFLRIAISSLVVFTLSLGAVAYAKPVPGKKYKDWTVGCEKLDQSSKKELCHIYHNVTNKENKKVMMQIAVGYLPGQDQPQVLITLPLGIMLTPGIEFSGGKMKAVRIPFSVCTPNGCTAGIVLEDDMIKKLKLGEKGKIKFAAVQNQVLEIPFSLSGFTAAINSLK
jgi:invasion protein IalB